MTLSTKIEVFTDFTFVSSGPSYCTCTAVARSLCVSWAFLSYIHNLIGQGNDDDRQVNAGPKIV